ncbi:ferritin-like domain-containing protein [Paracandidimonas lactea]|uniref:ferritin-like domain-containing protein n=1 Tax=Paracandidimonas lactea TaxID=2895524 RepID=UPI001EEFEED3|nr:ferritin-like domain-containing protein [Paracandidimonas lactea]
MPDQKDVEEHWTLDTIPYHMIDIGRARANEDLFYLVAGASFVEIAAELYTDNLIDYFSGDTEVVQWLAQRWKPEELRHGYSLRGYVEHVWPEFDWQRAYEGFFAEYSARCTLDEFEPARSLEMVARCVVETGTATFYQALGKMACEPVLAGIAARIRADEVGHYKYFYRFFRAYGERQPPGRLRILAALRRRMVEARNDDAEIALRHVHRIRMQPQGEPNADATMRDVMARLSGSVKQHYPVDMAAKMLLRPLDLPAPLARFLEGPVARATARILL